MEQIKDVLTAHLRAGTKLVTMSRVCHQDEGGSHALALQSSEWYKPWHTLVAQLANKKTVYFAKTSMEVEHVSASFFCVGKKASVDICNDEESQVENMLRRSYRSRS